MKKIQYFSLAAFVMAGTLLAGCSKVENEEPQVEDNIVTVRATVNLDNATRALDGITKTFAAGDQIAVLYQNKTAVSAPLTDSDISDGGKTATFTISLINPSTGTVTYVYPAAMAGEKGTVNLATLYKQQDGTKQSLEKKFDYAKGTGNITVSGATATLTSDANGVMDNQLAICKFYLKNTNNESLNGSITHLNISGGTNDYTIVRTAVDEPIYMAMDGIASTQNITVAATDGGNCYVKSVTNKTIEINNVYTVTVEMNNYQPALSGVFSVSLQKKVQFSRGNLQYQASTNTWRFAWAQWDCIGNAAGNTTTPEASRATQSAWIDLFGWATSGFNHNGLAYQPWSISTDDYDYRPYNPTNENLDLIDGGENAGKADWGCNTIINGGNGWRTLYNGPHSPYSVNPGTDSDDEWVYLFNTAGQNNTGRTDAYRFVMAQVHSKNGIIIFPDGFTPPGSVTITDPNKVNGEFSSNALTNEAWSALETAGCVFLPAAGNRNAANVYNVGSYGYYWSSYRNGANTAERVMFYNKALGAGGGEYLHQGFSVRLVRDIPVSTGSITVGDYDVENPATW